MHGFHFYLTFHYYHISLFYWEIVWEVRYNVGNCKQWPQQTYADWLDKKNLNAASGWCSLKLWYMLVFCFLLVLLSMFCNFCTPNWNHIFHNLCFMQANPTSCHILRLFRLEFVVRTDSDWLWFTNSCLYQETPIQLSLWITMNQNQSLSCCSVIKKTKPQHSSHGVKP